MTPGYRNARARCGGLSCTAGDLDVTTIAAGDQLHVFKRWHTVASAGPGPIDGTTVVIDDPDLRHSTTGTWTLDVPTWCRCQHRTAAQVLADRVAAEGSVQLDLFGDAA